MSDKYNENNNTSGLNPQNFTDPRNFISDEVIIPPGIKYRYVNNVDPNLDLICDSAYFGPVIIKNTTSTFKEDI